MMRTCCQSEVDSEHADGCWTQPHPTIDHGLKMLHEVGPGEIVRVPQTATFVLEFNTDWPTDQAQQIITTHLPYFVEEFLRKNRKYKAVDNSLGEKGVFPDVYRKVGILKSRVWDGDESIGESTDEVIRDLIGHLFLMLYMRGQGG